MKECIFTLGIFDKKLVWTLIFPIIQILKDLINNRLLKNRQHPELINLSGAIGQIFIIIIPYLPCLKHQNDSNEKKCTKRNFLFFFILILLNLIFHITIFINVSLTGAIGNFHETIFCSKADIEIILITLITFVFLKYKYFIHHIISLIIFCIAGVCIDLLLENFKENPLGKNYIEIIFFFVIILIEIINYCYQKYMMDKLYYNYWSLSLALGLSLFAQLFSALLYNLITKNKTTIDLFRDIGAGYIILGIFANIIIGFFQYLSRILILDYFTPNHMLIAYEFIKIYYVLTKSKSNNRWYSIILFIFQFLVLMFFLEIFEFNFCKLNENSKRNIMLRAGNEELIDDKSNKSNRNTMIELGTGYIINESKTRKSNELALLNQESEENSGRGSQINDN